MDVKMFEMALIYGAYDYENSTEIRTFLFSNKRNLKETLKNVLKSEETDLYKIEITVNLVDVDNDCENLTTDMLLDIDYQKYLEHKDFIES
jgi:hypothetical protein